MDGLPAKPGGLTGNQHAVVAKALHQRTDDLDGGSRQLGERCDGLFIFSLFGEAEQSRLIEFAVVLEPRHQTLGCGKVANVGHFAIGTRGDGRDGAADFLENVRWCA